MKITCSSHSGRDRSLSKRDRYETESDFKMQDAPANRLQALATCRGAAERKPTRACRESGSCSDRHGVKRRLLSHAQGPGSNISGDDRSITEDITKKA